MAAIGVRIWLSFAIGCASLLAGIAQAAVEISSKPTKNMSCSAGVCAPTARKAWLNASDLADRLAASDIKVVTGAGATVIEVTAPVRWVSGNRLALDSERSIIVKREVTVAGPGGLTLTTNDGGTDGILSFQNRGRVVFWDLTSSLVVDGQPFALINNIGVLAAAIAVNPDGNYALAKGVDASKDGSYSGSPVQTTLGGKLEGLGNAIKNMTLVVAEAKTGGCVGLLSDIAQGAEVRDIYLVKASVSASHGRLRVGILAGCNHGSVAAAHTDGLVQGTRQSAIGGLVGYNLGSIVGSDSDAAVDGGKGSDGGGEFIGGLVGYGFLGGISNSHATGAVSGGDGTTAGGLLGLGVGTSVVRTYATGNVSSGDHCCAHDAVAGGLVGSGWGISESFATGDVRVGSGDTREYNRWAYGGGLVGEGSATNSYSRGAVTIGFVSSVGGLVGMGSESSLDYSTGLVTGGLDWISDVGGFVGFDRNSPTNSNVYWDLDTSGVSDPSHGAGNTDNDPGITGLSDGQLKSGLPEGFDPAIWGQSTTINNGYPYLRANPPPG